MTTSKDTKAGKEGDKVNVIFLILASSDYHQIPSREMGFCENVVQMFCKTGI
jgi:hypothetical protein